MTRLLRSLALAVSLCLLAPASALAVDFVYATETVKANRFKEADSKEVGEVATGARVEVLFEDGERLRVRVQGATFGWIDKAKTSETKPEADTGADTE